MNISDLWIIVLIGIGLFITILTGYFLWEKLISNKWLLLSPYKGTSLF